MVQTEFKAGIEKTLKVLPAMITYFQEVDRRCQRSYEVNQRKRNYKRYS